MPTNPERGPNLEVRSEEITPLRIEKKEVVTPVPSQFSGQVMSDSGKPLIQTSTTKSVSVKIPENQVKLSDLSKGSTQNAITWFANFWLRIIKKAAYFGWKTIFEK